MSQKSKENFIWYLLSFALFIALYTEFLSFFNIINKLSVTIGWLIFIIFFYRLRKDYIDVNLLKNFFPKDIIHIIVFLFFL